MAQHDDRLAPADGFVVRPRIYLDIDGSICPLPPQVRDGWWSPPTDDWSSWVDPRAFNETPFPVELLDDLVALDWAEVVWATTWPLDMIEHAMDTAGYPAIRFRHLDPNGLYGKLDAVREDVERDPVPFVWIEDHRFSGERTWVPSVPRRRIRPNKYVGVSSRSWRMALKWLRAESSTSR